jgi:hypothetical protein
VYVDYQHARQAASRLNNAEVDGAKLRAVIKSKDKPPSKKSLKKSRLIVRNLPFNVWVGLAKGPAHVVASELH